jgi:GrpB-like predicted nucleotidyltransferase (UPF0157 family)
MKKYKLNIVDYDENWPDLYKRESEVLKKTIAGYDAVFEHVGCTSIPGLAGKPIIDIAIGIEEFKIASQLVEKIKSVGYFYEPSLELTIPDFKFLWKGDTLAESFDLHKFHVSIQPLKSNRWMNTLLFRDYLKNHPEAVEQYGDLKRMLSNKYTTDYKAYTRDKESFIQLIISKARSAH